LEKKRELNDVHAEVELESNSAHRAVVKVSLQLSARSRLVQRIVLVAGAVRLDFHTEVDWDENRKFLKVEFPLAVSSQQATFETQFGHLQRPTHRNTSWDWAKFEVCAHKWADLSEYGFGVALLNDCKYGYAVEGNVMRLSLLRSPKNPDPTCDIGHHSFVYSIMPHAGSFQSSGVIQEGYNLNVPLIVAPADSDVCVSLPPLFEVSNPAVVVETIKKPEKGENAVVVRLYEAFGSTARVELRTTLPAKHVTIIDILEEPIEKDTCSVVVDQADKRIVTAVLPPFRILTLKYTLFD
jgi:alpha-mannosidase